jgi:AcrR family transcriptional regulator
LARQAERREATRGALVSAARQCFAEAGYEATSTEAVLALAGVSKGALYHHFESKADLLAEVFAAVSRETAAKAQGAARRAAGPREALGAALKAWLRAARAPEPQRILLETGPAVLGFARARRIEDAITEPPMRLAINRAVEQGGASCADVTLAARLLNAAVAEMALMAIEDDVAGARLKRFDAAIDALIDALVPAR